MTFQEQVTARDPPSEYLNKLKIYLDPNKDKMSKNLKTLGNNTSTQVLRDLVSLFIFLNDYCLFKNSIDFTKKKLFFQEISLRTNNIEWVREFLSPQCNGLDTLIEYLTTRLCLMRHKLEVEKENNSNANTTDDWTVHSKYKIIIIKSFTISFFMNI